MPAFVMAKAGPYIGPRGGKWADPQHTIPWKPYAVRLGNGVAVAAKVGASGGLEAHTFDERDHAKQMVDSLAADGHRTRVYRPSPEHAFHVAIADESSAQFEAPASPLAETTSQPSGAPGSADLPAERSSSGWTPPAYGEKLSQIPASEKYSNKYIAGLIREDIKAAIKAGGIPRVKVSVRMRHHSIDVSITDAPFQVLNPERVKWEAENPSSIAPSYGPASEAYTPAAKQLIERLNAIHGAYNYDRSDISSDYFDVNYYGRADFDWRMIRDERADIRAGRFKPEGVLLPGPNKGRVVEPSEIVEPAPSSTEHEQDPASMAVSQVAAPIPTHLMELSEYRSAVMAGKAGDDEAQRLASAVVNAAANTPAQLHFAQRDFDKHTATSLLLEKVRNGVVGFGEVYDAEMRRIASDERKAHL